MPLYRLPRSPRRDSHGLVVVALGAPGGESVAQPEAVVLGNAIGDVGKRGRPLVGGDHQVRIVAVAANHPGRRHQASRDQIIRKIQQPADESLVTGDAFSLNCFPTSPRRQHLRHEATLGPDRHDDGVLDHLRLDQSEHLGTKILAAIRPAKPSPSNGPAAQMHALHAR